MYKTSLTWLHISDIHFLPKNEWRDCTARDSLINYFKEILNKDSSLRPNLVFCTGDIAFGETGSSPLSEQYKKAESFFDRLLAVCGKNGEPMPKGRLLIVPGNHDINRKSINPDAQETSTRKAQESINASTNARMFLEMQSSGLMNTDSSFKATCPINMMRMDGIAMLVSLTSMV